MTRYSIYMLIFLFPLFRVGGKCVFGKDSNYLKFVYEPLTSVCSWLAQTSEFEAQYSFPVMSFVTFVQGCWQ